MYLFHKLSQKSITMVSENLLLLLVLHVITTSGMHPMQNYYRRTQMDFDPQLVDCETMCSSYHEELATNRFVYHLEFYNYNECVDTCLKVIECPHGCTDCRDTRIYVIICHYL